jgi:hypothetical protein
MEHILAQVVGLQACLDLVPLLIGVAALLVVVGLLVPGGSEEKLGF